MTFNTRDFSSIQTENHQIRALNQKTRYPECQSEAANVRPNQCKLVKQSQCEKFSDATPLKDESVESGGGKRKEECKKGQSIEPLGNIHSHQ
jgi:hypothetical protein